jgi:cation diffusion facilitator family transporter
MYQMNSKIKVARLSIFSNLTLIILKLIAGFTSGAVSIISEAIHSSMDLIASLIAYFSVKVSDTPADKEHPYGHGKFENVSGVIEALLIIIAAIWIIIEAFKKFTKGEPLEALGISIAVMFISSVSNYLVSRQLYKVAKQTDSVALEADALHLKTDVYTSLGVGIGLALIWITNIRLFDPIAAILVAIFILRESYFLLRKAFLPLLDIAWEKEDLDKLISIIEKQSIRFHDLKTRKSGNYRFVEFHAEMPDQMPLIQVHRTCDEIETAIKKEFQYTNIIIHPEPTSQSM